MTTFLKLNDEGIHPDVVKHFVDNNDLKKIEIKLQSAPVKDVGVDGLQIDTVIKIIVDILKSFNQNVPSRETSLAITKLEEAEMWLDKRTKDRVIRDVEGTNME